MKKVLLFTLLPFVIIASQGKDEILKLTQKVQNQKVEINELSKQNIYYKEALNLQNPIKTLQIDGLQIDILKVIGSKKDLSVKIEFNYKNTTTENRSFFQCEQAFLTDPNGNQYQSYEIFVGANKNIRSENINPNIPLKANIIFKITDPTFPIIRQMKIRFYSDNAVKNGSLQTAVFENLDVDWN